MKPYRLRKYSLALVFLGVLSISTSWAKDKVWTNWYTKNAISALLYLSETRERLFENNIFSTYLSPPRSPECSANSKNARSADGSCNNLEASWEGSAGTRFDRSIRLEDVETETLDGTLLTPDPRKISRVLLTRDQFKPIPTLNLFAASWIQFMVHDWVNHANDEDKKEAFLLPLSQDDPFGQESMVLLKTLPDSTRSEMDAKLPPTYINTVTSWWDGSQIYGSDLEAQKKVRSFKEGLLKITADGHLPLDSDDIEVAGFKRNWWLGLSMMHHLFVVQHNKIAAMLLRSHGDWDDQRLFDVARLINVAVMAQIHTTEWTPAILNNPVLREGMHANWYGLINPSKTAMPWWKVALEKLTKNPVLEGIVGGQVNLHGKPYSLSEEFTSDYRMHSLLPESIQIKSFDDHHLLKDVPLKEMRDENASKLSHEFAIKDILYSMGTAHPGELTLNNYPQFMQQGLQIPIAGKIDLGTVDIFRDRERGVPRYNHFRKLMGLIPIRSFNDLTDDQSQVAKIRSVYGTTNGADNVDQLDFLIGNLAEGHRPTGFGFGETQFQEFLLAATRRLQADRFFTTDYNAATYTQEGLDWVDRASFKSVLTDAYPELKGALERVGSAFEPW